MTANDHPAADPAADPALELVAERAPLPARRRRRVVFATLLALVGAAATVAVPELQRTRLNANESAAIATLKNISSGQSQMQASGLLDRNGNGQGEYGFFGEMCGAVPIDAAGTRLDPPVLSARFGDVRDGRVELSGYVFQMFLRSADGTWVPESPRGGANAEAIGASEAEVEWLCYAWPVEVGVTGYRAFFMTQSGDVLACNMAVERYDGARGPAPGIAGFVFADAQWLLAANRQDARGNTWVVV